MSTKLKLQKLADQELASGPVSVYSETDVVTDKKSGVKTVYTRYIAFAYGPSFSDTLALLRNVMTENDTSLILAYDTTPQQILEYALEIGASGHKKLYDEAHRFMIWSHFRDVDEQAIVIKTAGDLRNALSGLFDDATIDILIAPAEAATMAKAVDVLIYHLSYITDNIYEDRAIFSLNIEDAVSM